MEHSNCAKNISGYERTATGCVTTHILGMSSYSASWFPALCWQQRIHWTVTQSETR